MRIAGLLLLFAAIAALDLPKLWKRRRKKELVVCSGILTLALSLCVLQTLRVPLGSPNRAVAAAVQVAKHAIGMP